MDFFKNISKYFKISSSSISLHKTQTIKVNKTSNIIHIQSENNLMQKNKLAYKQRKQNIWPKRNVPRSVSEKYEPNIDEDVHEIHEMRKHNLNEELKKNLNTSKRNRRGLGENISHPNSNHLNYKVILYTNFFKYKI